MISKDNIDNGSAFDWGYASRHYAQFRDIYPPKLYERLRELGVAADNTSWLDLGTGTGILPQNLYNKNAEITGVDISNEQILFAKQKAWENEWNINYFSAPAEHTELPDNSFDCITAAQCFAYFDRETIKREIKRLLKPGGKLIKIYMDWCPDDEITSKSIALVKNYNKNWSEGGILDDVYDDLFKGRITEHFYADIPFTRDSWHGRMCACRGTLASMNAEQFQQWNNAHTQMLSAYPEQFTVKHKVFISYFIIE